MTNNLSLKCQFFSYSYHVIGICLVYISAVKVPMEVVKVAIVMVEKRISGLIYDTIYINVT